MTRQDFVTEAYRRGMPEDEIRSAFSTLNARGAFADSKPAPVQAVAPKPVKQPVAASNTRSEMDVATGRGRTPQISVVGDPIDRLADKEVPSRTDMQALDLPKMNEGKRKEFAKVVKQAKQDGMLSSLKSWLKGNRSGLDSWVAGTLDVPLAGMISTAVREDYQQAAKRFEGGDNAYESMLNTFAKDKNQIRSEKMAKAGSYGVRPSEKDMSRSIEDEQSRALRRVERIAKKRDLTMREIQNALSSGVAPEEIPGGREGILARFKAQDEESIREFVANQSKAPTAESQTFPGKVVEGTARIFGDIPKYVTPHGVLNQVMTDAVTRTKEKRGPVVDIGDDGNLVLTRKGKDIDGGDVVKEMTLGAADLLIERSLDKMTLGFGRAVMKGAKKAAPKAVAKATEAVARAADIPLFKMMKNSKINQFLKSDKVRKINEVTQLQGAPTEFAEEMVQGLNQIIANVEGDERTFGVRVAEGAAEFADSAPELAASIILANVLKMGPVAASNYYERNELSKSDTAALRESLAWHGAKVTDKDVQGFLKDLYGTRNAAQGWSKVKRFIETAGLDVNEDAPMVQRLMQGFAEIDKLENPRERFLQALQDANDDKVDIDMSEKMQEVFGEWNQVASIVGEWGGDIAAPVTPEEQAAIDTARQAAPEKWNTYLEAARGRERVAIRVLLADQIQDAESEAIGAAARLNEETMTDEVSPFVMEQAEQGVPVEQNVPEGQQIQEDVQAQGDGEAVPPQVQVPVVPEGEADQQPEPAPEVPVEAPKKSAAVFEKIRAARAKKANEAEVKAVEQEKQSAIRADQKHKEELASWEAGKPEEVKAAEKTAGFSLLKQKSDEFRGDLQIVGPRGGKAKPVQIIRVDDAEHVYVKYQPGRGRTSTAIFESVPISRIIESKAAVGKKIVAEVQKDIPPEKKKGAKAGARAWKKLVYEHPYFQNEADLAEIEGQIGGMAQNIVKNKIIRRRTAEALKMIGEDPDIDIADIAKIAELLPKLEKALAEKQTEIDAKEVADVEDDSFDFGMNAITEEAPAAEAAPDVDVDFDPVPDNVTSLQEKVIMAERTERLGDYEPGGQTPWPELVKGAVATQKSKPNAGTILIAELKNGKMPDDADIALLLNELNARKITQKTLQSELDALIDSKANVKDIQEAEARLVNATNLLDEAYDVAAVGVGKFKSRMGAAFNALKMTVDEKFEIVNLELDYRARRGVNGVSSEEHQALEKVAKKYKTASDELAKVVEGLRKVIEEKQTNEDKLLARIASLTHYESLAKAVESYKPDERFVKRKKKEYTAKFHDALDRFTEGVGGGKASAVFVPDPQNIKNLLEVAYYGIGSGVLTWADAVVTKFGDSVKPYLDDAEKKAKLLLMQAEREPDGAVTDAEVDALKLSPEEKAARKQRNLIKRIYDEAIIAGADSMETATDAVMEIIKADHPNLANLTESQLQREFSDYGREVKRRPDELREMRNEIRRQIQVFESYQDVLSGINPQKTGTPRKPDSDRVRELKRVYEEALSKSGLRAKTERDKRSVLDAIERRMQNRLRDLKEAVAKGEKIKGDVKDAVLLTKDLEILKKQVADAQAEYDKMFPKELTDEQRLKIAIKMANRMLERLVKERDDALKGDFKKGRKPKPLPPSAVLEQRNAEIQAVRKEITDLKNASESYQIDKRIAVLRRTEKALRKRIADGNFTTKEKPMPIDVSKSPEGMKAIADLAQARADYARLKEIARLDNLSWMGKFWEGYGVANAFYKSYRTGADFGALMIQGGQMMVSNPVLWATKGVPSAFKAVLPKESAKMWQEITDDPDFALAKSGGLALSEGNGMGGYSNIDAIGKADLIERIPGLRIVGGASNRSFGATMNALRFSLFKLYVNNHENAGNLNIEELKAIAKHVNTVTGSGTLAGADVLNKIFWAPKLYWSSVELMTGKNLLWGFDKKIDKKGRRELMRMGARFYMRYAAGMIAQYAAVAVLRNLYLALGGDEEDDWFTVVTWNPTSSLRGAINIGNRYYNPLGRIGPQMTFLAQMLTGQYTTPDGERYLWNRRVAWGFVTDEMRSKGLARSRNIVANYLESKRDPMLAFLWELYTGEGFAGRERTIMDSLIDSALPINPQNIVESFKYRDPIASAIEAPFESMGASFRPDYNAPEVIHALESEDAWKKKFYATFWEGTTEENDKLEGYSKRAKDRNRVRAKEYYNYLRSTGMTHKQVKVLFWEESRKVGTPPKESTFDAHMRNLAEFDLPKKRK